MTNGDAVVVEISCERVWREISNYLEGETSTELHARMEGHFKGCKHCTAVLEGTRNVIRLAGRAAGFDPPAGFSKRLFQKLNRKLGQRMIRNQRTLFYVDDNCKALRLLTSVLSGCGYKVVTACDARQALEQMQHGSFDLILLGYRLPRMIDCKLSEIGRLSAGTPIIVVSGYNLLAPEELPYVSAYVGQHTTLDDLLTQIRILISQKNTSDTTPASR
jgi:CheY-like chemotaxis protein